MLTSTLGILLYSALLVTVSTGITFRLLSQSAASSLSASANPIPGLRSSSLSAPARTNAAVSRSATTAPLPCELECVDQAAILSKYGSHLKYNQQKCCTYHTDLRTMLKELDTFFRMQSIQYYISSGTLIGSLRSQTIIPWDLDADVYIPITPNESAMTKVHLSETYIKLLSWSTIMPASKFVLRPGAVLKGKLITSFKLHRKDQLFVDRLNINGPKVDLQLTMHEDNVDRSIHIANPYWYQKFVIPSSLVFPLKGCKLYDFSYPCPNKAHRYLQLLYGPNVLTRVESLKDYWSVLGNKGDGPQRKSPQDKKESVSR